MIAFYYALTGFACAIYYRRELTKSAKNFLFIGVGPVVGARDPGLPVLQGDRRVLQGRRLLFGQLRVRDRDPGGARRRAAGARGSPDAGLARDAEHESYFGRSREVVDPDVAAGRKLGVAAVPEEAV